MINPLEKFVGVVTFGFIGKNFLIPLSPVPSEPIYILLEMYSMFLMYFFIDVCVVCVTCKGKSNKKLRDTKEQGNIYFRIRELHIN